MAKTKRKVYIKLTETDHSGALGIASAYYPRHITFKYRSFNHTYKFFSFDTRSDKVLESINVK